MDKFSELKAAALAANPGPWAAELNDVWVVSDGTADFMLTDIFGDNELSAEQDRANAAFIAAANPAAVLALLAELEASKKSNAFLKEQLAKLANFNPDWDMLEACRESWREVAAALKEAEARLAAKDKLIAELEADELALIDERDSAEDVIAEMYEVATGNRPQWSSCFRFSDAVEDVVKMRARLTTPGWMPAAKDTSRGWAIDPDYLSVITERVGHSEDEGSPSMETVEAVLLATGFTVGDETANVAPAERQLVTAMGHQEGTRS